MALDFITYINYEAHPILKFFSDFLIPLFAAGLGAYCGSAINQKNKEFNDYKLNIQYIMYTNSILFALLNSLYALKEQFICNKEIDNEMKLLQQAKLTTFSQIKKINIKDIKEKFNQFVFCSKKVIIPKYEFPINEEKLKILADINMNIFSLIVSCRESLMNINAIIEQLNIHVSISEDDIRKTAYEGYYKKWYELRENFAKCIDEAISCIVLLIKCMNKSGTILAKKYKQISFKIIPINKLKVKKLYPKDVTLHKDLTKWADKNI
jgi:hypothetical protein